MSWYPVHGVVRGPGKKVTPLLRASGHLASPVTLAGLGDRSFSSRDQIDLTMHINDVITHVEMEGLSDITLVGWSYGGMVATGVAETIPDQIRAVVYLDGFVPEDGKALVDYLAPQARSANQVCADNDKPLLPLPLERFGVTERAVIDFVYAAPDAATLAHFLRAASNLCNLNSNTEVIYSLCKGEVATFRKHLCTRTSAEGLPDKHHRGRPLLSCECARTRRAAVTGISTGSAVRRGPAVFVRSLNRSWISCCGER